MGIRRHHSKSTCSSDDLLADDGLTNPRRAPVVTTISLPTLQMTYYQDGQLLFSRRTPVVVVTQSIYSSDHVFSFQNHLKSIWRVGSLVWGRSVEIKIIWRVGSPEAQPLQRKASLLYTLWPNFNKKWFIWRVGRLKCRFYVCHTNQ
jgi:hypothetical protein